MSNQDLFQHEDDWQDLPAEDAVEHLRQALRFRTVSYLDLSRIDYSQFDALHTYLRSAYPCVASAAIWEKIGYSLLIRIPGSNPSLRPVLFMAHEDVVPVIPGTEALWKHDPFSGDLADGFIWGRGAMDIKEMLIGILESAEYILRSGKRMARDVYFAFDEDEETQSHGAMAIVKTLKDRGVELAFVLDESAGDVMDAADYGAPGTLVCTIGTYEKGYADLALEVKAAGGHSSNPFHGTSLGILSTAIASIAAHPPKAHLSQAVRETLRLLGDRITQEPMCTWARDVDRYEGEILAWMKEHESLYHQVQTTVAPTMITPGAPAGNVMPGNMRAVINFRLAPPDTPESLMEHCRSLTGEDVSLSYEQQIGPSTPSDLTSWGYMALRRTLEHYFDRLVFIPVQNRAATDSRQYEVLSRCVLRFGPFLEEEKISAEGIHGINERISVRAYLQGIRVLIHLMMETCVEGENTLYD